MYAVEFLEVNLLSGCFTKSGVDVSGTTVWLTEVR